jgi:asparagine synthase (glutamine-hydrolysing)
LLLSGGIDSSVIAAAARLTGKDVSTFVFGLRHPLWQSKAEEDDLLHARRVANHTHLPHKQILLDRRILIHNVPSAIGLGETCRGTIIDDCVALMEVAQILAKSGFKTVWMGEAADDLFGGFKFALRYYRGAQLKKYFRHELDVSLPNELCIIQKVFEGVGISVVHPFWTKELKVMGYNLPLDCRVDSERLMKRILRDAFSDVLPHDICIRPKGITRDTTQIRWILEKRYGKSRERYRSIFHQIFQDGFKWPIAREK